MECENNCAQKTELKQCKQKRQQTIKKKQRSRNINAGALLQGADLRRLQQFKVKVYDMIMIQKEKCANQFFSQLADFVAGEKADAMICNRAKREKKNFKEQRAPMDFRR